jgi:D-alanine transaminase
MGVVLCIFTPAMKPRGSATACGLEMRTSLGTWHLGDDMRNIFTKPRTVVTFVRLSVRLTDSVLCPFNVVVVKIALAAPTDTSFIMAAKPLTCYLNGEYVLHSEAKVSVDDRGFLFSDGVYEVVKSFHGNIFTETEHMQRMRRGLSELSIHHALPVIDELPSIARKLLEINGLEDVDATIYIQITRGAAPRAHAYPNPPVAPTVYIIAKPFKAPAPTVFEDGVKCTTTPDIRWARCDIKSISLLPNVMANQKAKESGCYECLFIRDGNIVEASHSNVFAVIGGEVYTHPHDNILPGITRQVILDNAGALGIKVKEEPIPWSKLPEVTEMFVTASTTELIPVIQVDAHTIGDGKVGPIVKAIRAAWPSFVEKDAKKA